MLPFRADPVFRSSSSRTWSATKNPDWSGGGSLDSLLLELGRVFLLRDAFHVVLPLVVPILRRLRWKTKFVGQLIAATPRVRALQRRQIQRLDHIDYIARQVRLGQPFLYRGRRQVVRLAADWAEAAHALRIRGRCGTLQGVVRQAASRCERHEPAALIEHDRRLPVVCLFAIKGDLQAMVDRARLRRSAPDRPPVRE